MHPSQTNSNGLLTMRLSYKLMGSENTTFSVGVANTKLRFKGSNLRIKYYEKNKLYSIKDGKKVHFFGNLIRGYGLYGKGIKRRAEILYNSYLLNKIKFNHNDYVIDCGANYGDLWLSLEGQIKPNRYITFEPGLLEHEAIKMNAPGGAHNKLGLSNKSGIIRFFVSEQNADSSIVEPSNYSHFVDIETITLSEFLDAKKIKKIKLFKLEAEGFEPEILDGASEVLGNIEYIAVDGGYERGKNHDETFTQLCNYLIVKCFQMISINFDWSRALFKNQKFK